MRTLKPSINLEDDKPSTKTYFRLGLILICSILITLTLFGAGLYYCMHAGK